MTIAQLEVNEYLELALQHGGDPDFLVESFYPGGKLSSSDSIIYSAIRRNRFDSVQMLVRYGANLDYRGFSGRTPSEAAATIDRFEMVFFFLEQGADPTIKNNFGTNLIDKILEYGCVDIDPKGQQCDWYLKVVDKLKDQSLIDADWNPNQTGFMTNVE